MMLTINLPLVSPAAGALSDGALRGQIDETTYLAVVSDSRLAGNIYAVRKDVSALGTTFVDVSGAAGNDNPADFAIWNPTANFGAGDKCYIACDNPIKRIYARIATPGVWAGAGLEIRYSSDGVYEDKELAAFTDGANGFRNAAGIYAIDVTWPGDIVSFSPLPGSTADIAAGRAVESRRWLTLAPKNPTGFTMAPVLDRIWIEHIDGSVSYLDLTGQANAAISPAPTQNTTGFFPVVESSVYYCTEFPALGEERYIFLRQAANRTRVVEYLAADDTWKAMPSVSDPSNDFTGGPATYTATPTKFRARWSVPADWASKARTFGAVSRTGYWRRIRTTAVSPVGPMNPATTVVRAKQFGTANTSGDIVTAFVARRMSVKRRGSATGSGAVDLQLINYTKATSVTVSFPEADNGAEQNFPFPGSGLVFEDGDRLGIFYAGGTRVLSDAEIVIYS